MDSTQFTYTLAESATSPATGTITADGNGGLPSAYNLYFGLDGNLYVLSGDPLRGSSSSGIWRYNGQTGAFVDNFIPAGSHGLTEDDAALFLSPQAAFNPSGPSTIEGLDINRFGGPGIELESPGGNVVTGNYIGTDISGTIALANGGAGVLALNSASNTIGRGTPDTRNVISGNGTQNIPYQNSILNDGVDLIGAGSQQNFVAGNYLGTNASGTAAIGNTGAGVFTYGGAGSNTIGTNLDGGGEGDLISGNLDGVYLDGAGNNLVAGNFIGTDATGTYAVANTGTNNGGVPGTGRGVIIADGSSQNTIGGTVTVARNIISGNAAEGVQLDGVGTNDNVVLGNYIGTDVTGTVALPNASHGVFIYTSASFNTIGGTAAGAGNVISGNALRGIRIRDESGDTAPIVGNQILGNSIGVDANGNPLPNGTSGSNNGGISILSVSQAVTGTIIGGSVPGAANIIADNDGPGITVEGAGATGNTIQGNSIYGNTRFGNNTGLGIDLGADGVTPNHTGFEAGPNNFQNYPVLIGAQPGDGFTEIVGTFNSLPNATYTLDFYDSPAPDPTGFGQGKTWLGSATVITDSSGNVRFDVSVIGNNGFSANVGDSITATATDSSGNTSEFSRFVVAGLLVTNTNDSGDGSLRQAILNADASSIPLPKTIGFNIPGGVVQTIAPASALPVITTPVILDGYTQPGASPNTLTTGDNAVLQIVINGAAPPGPECTD